PYIIYADPVLEPPPDVRPEWWIYLRLADALGVTLFDNRLYSAATKLYARLQPGPLGRLLPGPEKLIDGMFKQAGLPGIREMAEKHPHGLLLPENEGGNFLGTDRVLTPHRKVDLAPEPIVAAFEATAERFYAE